MAAFHALIAATVLALAASQAAAPAGDPIAELAAKIAAAIRPAATVTLTIEAGDAGDPVTRRQMLAALTTALRSSGVRVVDRDAAAAVTAGCLDNLRERVCLADIVRGAARDVVSVVRAHTESWRPTSVAPSAERPLSFEIRPVFAQRAPILDVALMGDRLVVLDGPPEGGHYASREGGRNASVTLYLHAGAEWRRVDSRPIAAPKTWPRDLRGRLSVDGSSIQVFLPGLTCRSAVDLGGFACVDGRTEWPIGLSNDGIDPRRNHFATPAGQPFFSAAQLSATAPVEWMVADASGRLAVFDTSWRRGPEAGVADDVAAIRVPCAAGPHVLASVPLARRDADALRLFRVVDRQLVPLASAVDFTGVMTALWSSSGATMATAVTYDRSTDWYEAFQISIGCDR